MATHTSILAWKIPWTEEPDRLQSTGSQRVGHNWVTELNRNPLQYSCLENSMNRGAWWATVHGVAVSNIMERLALSLFSFFYSVIQRPLFLFWGLNWIQELGCCVFSCSHSLWERTQKWQSRSRKIYDRNFGFQGFSWFGLELFPVYTPPIRCLPSLLLNWNLVHLYVFTCPSSTCPQQLICK